MAEFIPEATYPVVFNDYSATIHSFVDPVENRRYYNLENNQYPETFVEPMSTAVNYKGTGAPPSSITPQIVFEQDIPDEVINNGEINNKRLIFLLPDVNAYFMLRYAQQPQYDDLGNITGYVPDGYLEMLNKLV